MERDINVENVFFPFTRFDLSNTFSLESRRTRYGGVLNENVRRRVETTNNQRLVRPFATNLSGSKRPFPIGDGAIVLTYDSYGLIRNEILVRSSVRRCIIIAAARRVRYVSRTFLAYGPKLYGEV